MRITCFNDLAEEAKKMTRKTVVAVVEAHDRNTLESVIKAASDGIMVPLLIGRAAEIKEILIKLGESPAEFEIIDSAGVEKSLEIAVESIREDRKSTRLNSSH